MTRGSLRRNVGGLGLVAAALVASGCGDEEPSPEIHSLAEPWQRVPFAISQDVLVTADAACHRRQIVPADTPLVVADARGGELLLLVYAAPGREAECLVRAGGAGSPVVDGGGSSGGDNGPPPGPGSIAIYTSGASETQDETGRSVARSFIIGRTGAGVAAVEVTVNAGEGIWATVANGWFGAWWPGSSSHDRVRAYDSRGTPTGVAQ